jgi:hypothetical protein
MCKEQSGKTGSGHTENLFLIIEPKSFMIGLTQASL